ncbi:FhaA domain-containing protein [Propionibacterium freudenreichii]|uniref:FhaA domain-containing protein n=1 Tax=Propionibacterium freudenreichii TaxID=1744 RepID=UPI0005434652|nr:DUF3662 and FHA domain-containing protein [Propionibacterium freudenreichii]MCT2978249.1 DUF2662 domain-containing protein [Propionibacterium freudenreichii]MCT2986759.1 DUF2662 domain-containing protein [Propionibacterium freudenreichii]MCT3000084.1 DUF2662 domain-containing protein [Propionibacterium freudenreichii]MDK9319650.1 DUF3662 domain-containing protein [Propionibacterium freudenreichii]MDK9348766.1 DUF3662 domain-containing protein [Propionibacterium freudenreichii]
MGLFDRVEKKLESAVNGVFARAFKGDVQPVEIASRLQRELDSEAKLLSRDKRLVPNDFQVHLSTHDYDRLAPYSRTLNAEIVPDLREHVSDRGYVFDGPIHIEYVLDDSLPTGRFEVTSASVATVAENGGAASSTMIRRAPLVLEVNGVRHPLMPPGFTIGRGTEADLRINDPGVSRKHARINVSENADGELLISIDDLGSTNGVIVNGQRVTHSPLEDGSRIEMGSTRMLVHSPVGT